MATLNKILVNEKEIFHRLSSGDPQAFTEIFRFYEPVIYPFLRKLTKSEILAEEMVQELFIKLWLSRKNLDTVENHRSYIFRMAANLSVNYLRKMERESHYAILAAAQNKGAENLTEQIMDFKETQESIHHGLQKLTPQQKAVYELSRQQGLKNHEIASLLNISEKTVKNHLTKALHHIKNYLSQLPENKVAFILLIALAVEEELGWIL